MRWRERARDRRDVGMDNNIEKKLSKRNQTKNNFDSLWVPRGHAQITQGFSNDGLVFWEASKKCGGAKVQGAYASLRWAFPSGLVLAVLSPRSTCPCPALT